MGVPLIQVTRKRRINSSLPSLQVQSPPFCTSICENAKKKREERESRRVRDRDRERERGKKGPRSFLIGKKWIKENFWSDEKTERSKDDTAVTGTSSPSPSLSPASSCPNQKLRTPFLSLSLSQNKSSTCTRSERCPLRSDNKRTWILQALKYTRRLDLQ